MLRQPLSWAAGKRRDGKGQESMAGSKDLHQKKMSTWVTAVSRARLRRQPTPIRGRADSRQTTLSTVVTSSDGSSPFNLKQAGVSKHAGPTSPQPAGKATMEGWGLSCSEQPEGPGCAPSCKPHTGYLGSSSFKDGSELEPLPLTRRPPLPGLWQPLSECRRLSCKLDPTSQHRETEMCY